jgi:hypothetical protein
MHKQLAADAAMVPILSAPSPIKHGCEAAMTITLRPAQTFVALSGANVNDDFDVMDDGRRIGRIYQSVGGREPWCWSVSRAIAPNGFSGRAVTRVLALQMLVDTYRAVKSLEGGERRYALPPAVNYTPIGRAARSPQANDIGRLFRGRS